MVKRGSNHRTIRYVRRKLNSHHILVPFASKEVNPLFKGMSASLADGDRGYPAERSAGAIAVRGSPPQRRFDRHQIAQDSVLMPSVLMPRDSQSVCQAAAVRISVGSRRMGGGRTLGLT